jgi:hypothetical protein
MKQDAMTTVIVQGCRIDGAFRVVERRADGRLMLDPLPEETADQARAALGSRAMTPEEFDAHFGHLPHRPREVAHTGTQRCSERTTGTPTCAASARAARSSRGTFACGWSATESRGQLRREAQGRDGARLARCVKLYLDHRRSCSQRHRQDAGLRREAGRDYGASAGTGNRVNVPSPQYAGRAFLDHWREPKGMQRLGSRSPPKEGNMRIRTTTLAAVVMAGTLAVPATASAGYYMSKREAESTTRRYLHRTLGYHHTVADCRPQGLKKPEPGYIYHRWVCGWAAGDSYPDPDCLGTSLVRGSRDESQFYWKVLYHDGDCQYGWDD